MGFEQYHEPPRELPEETRTFARMIASLTEEAEAINWYQQRMAVEKDEQAKAIMEDAQGEEFRRGPVPRHPHQGARRRGRPGGQARSETP